MSTEAFRKFVKSNISDKAQFDMHGFSLRMSFDEYIQSYRSILHLLQREIDDSFMAEYNFNLKHGKFFRHSFP